MPEKKLKITVIKSANKRQKKHKATLEALGLRKMHKTVERADNPAVRGMVRQLRYMLKVEES